MQTQTHQLYQHPAAMETNNQTQYHLPSIQSLHPSQAHMQQQHQPQPLHQHQHQHIVPLHQHQHQQILSQAPPSYQQKQLPQTPLQQQQQQQQQQLQQQENQQQQPQHQQVKQENQNQQDLPQSSTQKQSLATLRRGPWSPEEDRLLLEAISIFGPSNWVRNSQALGSRTPKQCRERYHQNLKPSLNRNPITPEEGRLIEELVARYGKRWAEIARHLNGRSDNAIKNWWNGGANRRRRASTQAIVDPSNHQQNIQPLQNHDYNAGHHHHQPSFNVSIFQQQQQDSNDQNSQPLHMMHLGPLHPLANQQQQQQQQQQPLAPHNIGQQMPPPFPTSRSSSITQEMFQQQPGVKRLLEEQQMLPARRHSAQTILSTGGSSPFSIGGSSRNSSISVDFHSVNNNSNQTSRRSSLAHELFPNPFQGSSKRLSSSYLSPSFTSRNSISGLPSGLTPLTSSQQVSSSTTQQYPQQSSTPLLDSNTEFSGAKPPSSDPIKLPPPSSIHFQRNHELSKYQSQESLHTSRSAESLKSNNINNSTTTSTSPNNSMVSNGSGSELKIKLENENENENEEKDKNGISTGDGEKKVMNISNLLS